MILQVDVSQNIVSELQSQSLKANPELQLKGFGRQMTTANDLPSHWITFTVTIVKQSGGKPIVLAIYTI